MGVISFVAIQLRGKCRAQVLAGVHFRSPGICLKLLKLLTLTASEVVLYCTTKTVIFRPPNRRGKPCVFRGFMWARASRSCWSENPHGRELFLHARGRSRLH